MKEIVMFYNSENFFSADPAPVHRTDPTPSGLRNWNDYRYKNKLMKICRVVELLSTAEGLMPAAIALSEVQGKKVLEDIIAQPIFGGRYAMVHYESMDERGVDTALLYDKEKIKILHSEPISFFFDNENIAGANIDTTRDILFCKADFLGTMINFFVLHLPSKRAGDVNKPKRAYILSELYEKVKSLVSRGESVILLGDFNENPDEENLMKLANPQILKNPAVEKFKNGIFSTFHGKDGLLFDQILLSNDFFDKDNPAVFGDFKIFSSSEIAERGGRFAGRPFRTYAGSRYIGGYSDHFPVYAVLEIFKKNQDI